MKLRQGAVVTADDLRRGQSERDFQKSVTDLLDARGWLWWHDRDSRKNKRGLPDLIALRIPRLLFAELKSTDGRMRVDQLLWIAGLEMVPGVEAYVWRPADWDRIEEILC